MNNEQNRIEPPRRTKDARAFTADIKSHADRGQLVNCDSSLIRYGNAAVSAKKKKRTTSPCRRLRRFISGRHADVDRFCSPFIAAESKTAVPRSIIGSTDRGTPHRNFNEIILLGLYLHLSLRGTNEELLHGMIYIDYNTMRLECKGLSHRTRIAENLKGETL